MKKPLHYLCAAMLAAAALPVAAQTAEKPQVIVPGENTVTDPKAYLTFTATEDCVVTFEGLYVGYDPFTYTEDGNTVNVSTAGEYGQWTKFAAEAGVTYTLHIDKSDSEMPLTFTCVTTPVKTFGFDCSDPIVLNAGEEVFIPTHSGADYTNVPVYLTYTGKAEERLVLACNTSFQYVSYGSECGNFDGDLPYDFQYPDYNYELVVGEGETVVFQCNGSTPVAATVKVVEVVPGASCKDPFETKAGNNVIPAAAGEYWYSVDFPAKKSMLVLTSDAELPVTLYRDCSPYGGTDFTTPNFRFGPVDPEANRLLCITKAAPTDAPESFTLEFADLLPIEDNEVGQSIKAGEEVNVPGESGYYYYSIQAPEGDPVLMVVTSDYEGSGRPLNVHPLGSYYPNIGSGANFKGEVTPGVIYLVEASGTTDQPFSFNVTFVPLEPGQLENHPLTLEFGDNVLPDFSPVYYRYESDVEAKLHLDPSLDGTSITVKQSYYTVDTDPEDVTFIANASKPYIIVVTKPEGKESDPCTLNVSQLDFAPGESWTTAIEVKGNEQTLPDGPLNMWYMVTAEQDGFFLMETTMAYDYNNAMKVYVGSVNDNNAQQMPYSYSDMRYSTFKTGVAKGQNVYINVVTNLEQTGVLTFKFEDAKEGEIASKPIAIDFTAPSMDYEFPADLSSYSDSYRWYSLELPAGLFSCTAEASVNVALYNADNTEVPVASGSWISSGMYGVRNAGIAEGKYLLRITDTGSSPVVATIQVSEPQPGQIAATAIELDVTELPAAITCPLLESDSDNFWVKFNVYPGELNIAGDEGNYYYGFLYSEKDLKTALTSVTSISSDGAYYYGINDYKVAEADVYYLQFTRSNAPVVVSFSGSALEAPFEGTMVNVEVVDGQAFSFQLPNDVQSAFALALPADFSVASAELNGEEVEVADLYKFVTAGEDLNYVFTVEYDGDIQFVDTTTGVVEIDAKIKVSVIDGKIRIDGTSVGDHVAVYTVGGLLVANYTAQNTALEIELPAGTYVVLVNGSAAKVLL